MTFSPSTSLRLIGPLKAPQTLIGLNRWELQWIHTEKTRRILDCRRFSTKEKMGLFDIPFPFEPQASDCLLKRPRLPHRSLNAAVNIPVSKLWLLMSGPFLFYLNCLLKRKTWRIHIKLLQSNVNTRQRHSSGHINYHFCFWKQKLIKVKY